MICVGSPCDCVKSIIKLMKNVRFERLWSRIELDGLLGYKGEKAKVGIANLFIYNIYLLVGQLEKLKPA